jgi:choline dehydrogenase
VLQAEPDPSVGGRPDVWPAGKRLGGGSSINGMMFIRGHQWDYDHWAELGATGWDYASVLPYFRRLEDNERGADAWRGQGGPIAVSEVRSRYEVTDEWIEAAQQAGIARSPDLNGETAEGVDHIQLSQRSGLRCSTAAGYLRTSRPPRNPARSPGAQDRVADGRAHGVTIRRGGEVLTLTAQARRRPQRRRAQHPAAADAVGHRPAEPPAGAWHRGRPRPRRRRPEPAGAPGCHLVNAVSAHTLNDDARGFAGFRQLLELAFARSGALTTGIGHAQAFVKSREGCPRPTSSSPSAPSPSRSPQGQPRAGEGRAVSTFVAVTRPSSRGTISLRSNDPTPRR